MGKKLTLFALLFTAGVWASTTETMVRFEKAYIPTGFDSNDSSQVVVVGTFPDTCHQVGAADYKLDPATGVITVFQRATVFSGNCLPMTVPFQSVITLGRLEPASLTIQDGMSGQALGQLSVTLAKDSGPGTDDYPYAPLTDAYVETNPNSGKSELVLVGNWTDRCTRFKRIDLHYYTDVLVVQPIVERIGSIGLVCTKGIFRFQKRIALRPMASRAFLVHVRSMAGNAINKIYYQ